MVLVLPSFSEGRPDGTVPASWWLFPLAEEVVEVPTLVGAIEALRAQGLTGSVVVRTFIQRRILSLRERVHPLWQHQGITDPMIPLSYHGGATPSADARGGYHELPWGGRRASPLQHRSSSTGRPSVHLDGVGAPGPAF
jgi:hypothetical protein